MTIYNFNNKNLFCNDVIYLLFFLVFIFFAPFTYISSTLGLFTLLCFFVGCFFTIVVLKYQLNIIIQFQRIKSCFCSPKIYEDEDHLMCTVCSIKQCQRHKPIYQREPWKGLLINQELDSAIEKFYNRILDNFVQSWFSMVSNNEDFIYTLKLGLREATSHFILKMKCANSIYLVTNKILPNCFEHIEVVKTMLESGISMDQLPNGFILNEKQIHPAVVNRKAEIDYLRTVAKCLLPRLFHNENFESKIFFSLVRELIACWVLLPLMDAISDPNLINLLVIICTNKKVLRKKKRLTTDKKVEFLNEFVNRPNKTIIINDDTFLNERSQLYAFMQFLKKEGAVDMLSFYLDVENLNKELSDPQATTDPAKLSSLYKQSEKLLQCYKNLKISCDEFKDDNVNSLTEAHNVVKNIFERKWRKAFHKTSEYFELVYGSNEIKSYNNEDSEQLGTVSRIGSKLKDALRGAIDPAPLEATEIPTVWDAFLEQQASSSNTIYGSVTQKLRKERGQNLDVFLNTFMQSLEQRPDIGEDVVENKKVNKNLQFQPPGRNLVFANLFGLNKPLRRSQVRGSISNVMGPSQCFIYILHRILKMPQIIVRLVFALVSISESITDSIICYIIRKLITNGLYEPRLSEMIKQLEAYIFDVKSIEIQPTELLERQRQARKRLEELKNGTGYLADVLQSPALNKHLMYCIFDEIITEIYPEMSFNDD